MPILILTSENIALEKEIAQKIAHRMNYSMLDQQFLNKVSDKYNIDRKKMVETMINTPSILKRIPAKIWNYFISCVEIEALEQLIEDDCVCSGLGAHLYVMSISHVLKVRLIGGYKVSPSHEQSVSSRKKQQKIIADQEYKADNWSMAAFNRKASDSGLYDMVINMDQMQVDETIENICATLKYPRFKAMTYSKNNLIDTALAARVKNLMLKTLTDIHVSANNGTVVVTTTSVKREKEKKIGTIKQIAEKIDGIGYLEVHWNKDIITEASMSFR